MSATKSFVVANLTFAHGRTMALSGVDLAIPTGSILGLVGDNGAGKTTLISILARHLRCPSGQLAGPDGVPWDALRIGWMASDSIALPDMAVETFLVKTLGPATGLHVDASRTRARTLAQALGVQDVLRSRPSRISRGQKIRCALIAALLESPDLVLLDEPFLGLDPSATDRARDVIRRECADHATTFLVSDHRLDVLQDLCDAWAFLVEGRVASTVTRDDVHDLAARYREVNP